MKVRIFILLVFVMLFGAIWSYEKAKETHGNLENVAMKISEGPPCVKLYDYLIKYSEKHGVPFQIAYRVAQVESGYEGPFHWKYNPALTSPMNAYGAMQVQAPTASFIWKRKVSPKELLNNLEFNVETGVMVLKYYHSLCGRWDIALGYYNTGRPMVNNYSIKIMKD